MDEGAADGPDGRQGRQEREDGVAGSGGLGGVALVLLAEAHAALAAALGHAHVVHQPEVDVEIVRAGSPDAVLGTAELLDQLDTATLALPDGRHVLHGEGVVERILAP